jgi:hypothetical protein
MGTLGGYAPATINNELTRFDSDDVNPRVLYVHIRWLPYRAPPMDSLARSKMFMFYPEPVIHLTEPTVGVEREPATRARSRTKKGGGLLQTMGSYIGLSKQDSDDMDSVVEVDRGEPKTKKRKVGDVE